MPIRAAHRQALDVLRERLAPLDLPWAVTGSVALQLHGLLVTSADLDVATTAAAAPRIAAAFADEVTAPVSPRTRDGLRGHIGALAIGEVEVEVLGDVQNALPGGGWTEPPDIARDREWVVLDEHALPVLGLDTLLAAYRAMGRTGTASLIEAAFRR